MSINRNTQDIPQGRSISAVIFMVMGQDDLPNIAGPGNFNNFPPQMTQTRINHEIIHHIKLDRHHGSAERGPAKFISFHIPESMRFN